MEKPTQSELQALGISQAYASLILNGHRDPSRALAVHIFRNTNWRHGILDGLSDAELALLEKIEPWQPKDAAA